jgi:hypothetical protein
MDDPTDMALGISAAIGLALCGIGVCIAAWKNNRGPNLKTSKSDTDLSLILENSIPSASAMTVRRLTPPDDPTSGPSEERYA